MERLEEAHAGDARYHAAKLGAAAFQDPARIWDEHGEFRRHVLPLPGSPTPMDRTEQVTLALSIQQRMVDAGIIPPPSGAVN
jgi:hypothetical protein